MQIDAVLPLVLKDVPRAEFLLASLAQNFFGLRQIWIVCPDAQVQSIKFRFATINLPFELRIEPELSIVPEFSLKTRQSGWFRQQMIKLAIYEHVESDLYLTLDADVVCSRRVTAEQLAGSGKGACFRFEFPEQIYWYRQIEDVLRIKIPHLGVSHNVTPALLHRAGVHALRQHVEAMIARSQYSRGLRGIKQRWHLSKSVKKAHYAAWRIFLVAGRPWTEYALYYSLLEATNCFNDYHALSDCIYDIQRSLWHANDSQIPAAWDPKPAFGGDGPPWFIVAQSNTGISAEKIQQRLQPLLEEFR